MNISDCVEKTWKQEAKEKEDWAGDYDGSDCPNCGRQRVIKCTNGKRRCEKCNYDADSNTYSDCPSHVWH